MPLAFNSLPGSLFRISPAIFLSYQFQMPQSSKTSGISKMCSLIKLVLRLEKYCGIHLTDFPTLLNSAKDLAPQDMYSLQLHSASQEVSTNFSSSSPAWYKKEYLKSIFPTLGLHKML